MYLHAGKLESIIKIMTTDTGNAECFTPDGKYILIMMIAYYSQAKSNEIGLNLMLRNKKIDTI